MSEQKDTPAGMVIINFVDKDGNFLFDTEFTEAEYSAMVKSADARGLTLEEWVTDSLTLALRDEEYLAD